MKRKNFWQRLSIVNLIVIAIAAVTLLAFYLPGDNGADKAGNLPGEKPGDLITGIEAHIEELMKEGDIPGLSLVVIRGEAVFIKCFGYADKEKKTAVTADTLFELGSCSKAFTALAAVQMAEQGLIDLDDPVSAYFPWFSLKYRGEPHKITLRQLLHQTGGIPWNAIGSIPVGSQENALEQTLRNLQENVELEHIPGETHVYSTVNYDVVGAIIEKASGMSFEAYMKENIFKPLALHHTRVGMDQANPPPGMARGYKIGFFAPRPYRAPVYRGNNPAGYVVSNARDAAQWLKFQIGTAQTPLYPLIRETHRPNLAVDPDTQSMNSYAMGWMVNEYENGSISHGGLNPNFTAYMGINPGTQTAAAVLANSNSPYTYFIGGRVLELLQGQEVTWEFTGDNSLDKVCSLISLLLVFFLLMLVLFFVSIGYDWHKGRREFAGLTLAKIGKMLAAPLVLSPFLLGLYWVPKALANATWEFALVWAPQSFHTAALLLLTLLAASYPLYVISTLFPPKNRYIKTIPPILALSLLGGGANAALIFIVTGSIYAKTSTIYLIYYYLLAVLLYIAGQKGVQARLVKLTAAIVYDLRMLLLGKIFNTSFQRFEQIETGRILTTLSNDTSQVANSANLFVGVITSAITFIGVFTYLAVTAFWATATTLLVIIAVAFLYYLVSRHSEKYFEEARDTQNSYMGLLDGLVDGFKELSLHFKKKKEYHQDLGNTCNTFRQKQFTALIKNINAFLVGESILIIVLGTVALAVPQIFPRVKNFTLMGFIVGLLYLIGPVNNLLSSIPTLMQIRVAWNRIRAFIHDIPANINPDQIGKPLPVEKNQVQCIEAKGVMFAYKSPKTNGNPAAESDQEKKMFTVGPLDFTANKGEIVFIVGGNGSGKTTLLKMLTGLYELDQGGIEINNREIPPHQLGEYFSVVFSNYHLFQKIYDVDMKEKQSEAEKCLQTLDLEDKVQIEGNEFSTIQLSGGQRKRLALFRVYMENSPIFLFDEVAADQDPRFREFFYRHLLQQMKNEGKIVIGITHDDHYFDAADRVIKMDMGKIDYETTGSETQPGASPMEKGELA